MSDQPFKTMHRTVKSSHFTTLSNAMLRDKRLSFKARGILAMSLSNADEWQVHQGWLSEQGTEGREAIKSGMQELESFGYVRYSENRKAGKIIGAIWTFHEEPIAESDRTNRTNWKDSPCYGKPEDGKPCHGNPSPKKEQGTEEQRKEGAQSATEIALFPTTSLETTTIDTQLLDAWNALPDPFPKIRSMSPGRSRALNARMKDAFWNVYWKQAMERMKASRFLMGENERKWIADVDFFLRPDTVAKIMECKYDTPGTGKPAVEEWRKHWPTWLRDNNRKPVEYQFAADHDKSTFWAWLKKQPFYTPSTKTKAA